MILIQRVCLTLALLVVANGQLNAAPKNESPEAARDTPNVILIYADDLGIGMLGSYGQKVVTTPNIDRLATEGMKFNNYYGGTFCAPSRWTLLTGMHDGRCLLYTSPSPRDQRGSRMPSSA